MRIIWCMRVRRCVRVYRGNCDFQSEFGSFFFSILISYMSLLLFTRHIVFSSRLCNLCVCVYCAREKKNTQKK